jgi:hypothetical protein
MPKAAKSSLAKKVILLEPRKVKELQHLLNAATEGEAVRKAIEESVANHRVARSLAHFLDALAREQASSRQ